MFAICPNKVYKNKDLTGVDIKVYLAIQGFSDEDGYCFPSIAKIADICGVCRRTVERSLSHLEELKFIARQKRIKDNGGYTSNGYYLKLDPESDASSMSHTIRQESRIPYDNNVATNNNQGNNNIFKYIYTRASTQKLGKRSDVSTYEIKTEDLADVERCLSDVIGAKDYNFFITNKGIIGARPSGKFLQNDETEKELKRYFNQSLKRDFIVRSFQVHGTDEILLTQAKKGA